MSLQREKRGKKILKHKQTWYKQMHVSKDWKLKKKDKKKKTQQQQTTPPTTKKHVAIQLNKCCL